MFQPNSSVPGRALSHSTPVPGGAELQGFAAAGRRPAFKPRLPYPAAPLAASAAKGGISAMILVLGFYALALNVPIAEIIIVYLHAHIPVAWMAYALLTVFMLTTGRLGAFMSSPVAGPWLVVLLLFAVAAVTGFYPGRSIPFIFEYGTRFHLVPFYCCAMIVNTKQVRHVMLWIGWGSFILLALCVAFGQLSDGRLIIPDTDFANPNDLGLGILVVMGALLVFRSRFSRILAFIAMPGFILEILRTGSRACLLTLIALFVIIFMTVSTRMKITLLLLVPIIGGALLAAISGNTLSRLTLIVADTSKIGSTGNQELDDAIASQAARTELQKHAFDLALRHPLLGVGAGNLADAVDEMVRAMTGKKSGWQGAHNTYLEVGAENGIPAMLIYVWTLVICIKLNYRAYKRCKATPELAPAAAQSFALLLMTTAFAVCTTFSNNAYSPPLCVLVGLAAANLLAVEKEAKEFAAAQGPAPSQPAVRKPAAKRLPRVPLNPFPRPEWRA